MERFGAWPIYIRSSILHHRIVVVVVVHAAFDFSKFVTATLHYLFCAQSPMVRPLYKKGSKSFASDK